MHVALRRRLLPSLSVMVLSFRRRMRSWYSLVSSRSLVSSQSLMSFSASCMTAIVRSVASSSRHAMSLCYLFLILYPVCKYVTTCFPHIPYGLFLRFSFFNPSRIAPLDVGADGTPGPAADSMTAFPLAAGVMSVAPMAVRNSFVPWITVSFR